MAAAAWSPPYPPAALSGERSPARPRTASPFPRVTPYRSFRAEPSRAGLAAAPRRAAAGGRGGGRGGSARLGSAQVRRGLRQPGEGIFVPLPGLLQGCSSHRAVPCHLNEQPGSLLGLKPSVGFTCHLRKRGAKRAPRTNIPNKCFFLRKTQLSGTDLCFETDPCGWCSSPRRLYLARAAMNHRRPREASGVED